MNIWTEMGAKMWFIRVFVRHEQGIQMSILILYIISFYLNNISGALCDSYKRTEQHPSDNIIYTDLNKYYTEWNHIKLAQI